MKSKGRLLKDLEKEYKALAKQVNIQMREIKKEYRSSPAINVLLCKINRGNIGKRDNILLKPKKRNKRAYESAIVELKKYLTYKTATKEGYDALIQERILNIRSKNESASELSDAEIKNILDFLGSTRGEQSKEVYDSDQVIYASVLSKVGDKKKKLDDLFKELMDENAVIADYIREMEKSSDNEFINL